VFTFDRVIKLFRSCSMLD